MTRRRLVVVLLLIAVCAAGGWWWSAARAPHQHEPEKRTDAEGRVYYTCGMHPEVQRDEPGNCPICGMTLVRRTEAPPVVAPAGDGSVAIDPRIVQNLGIRTAPVARGAFAPRVDVAGAVEVDERRIVVVESRAAGWVERLDVRAVGDAVRKGQVIAGVYAPELYAAQEELALAARSGDAALVAASRQRLLLLGASENQVETIARGGAAQRRLIIAAPANGVVTELNVREGQQVLPGTPLLRLADLSRVWITAEIPESLAAALRRGAPAEARLAGLPGEVFQGEVDYVYPRLDTATRTVRARIALANPRLQLKPGMYADVSIAAGVGREALLVPSEAVIRTGERTLVIVAEGEGRFRPAMVRAGMDRGGQTEILEGLDAGDAVVVSGQFLIDSEASLRSALGRMGAPADPGAPEDPHAGHR